MLVISGPRDKVKGKGKVTLFNVGSSFSYEAGINESRRRALYPPPSFYQCSVLRVFKAIATRIRGKSKQTFKSPRIEPGTSRSESRALANWATTAPKYEYEGAASAQSDTPNELRFLAISELDGSILRKRETLGCSLDKINQLC